MNYTKTGNTLIPSGEFTWKVRMAFKETGIWTSRIIARDSVGETDIAGPVFTVLADNLENGYISVSSEDDRYFKYDNNTLFLAWAMVHLFPVLKMLMMKSKTGKKTN